MSVKSIYFHRDAAQQDQGVVSPSSSETVTTTRNLTFKEKLYNSKRYMVHDLKAAYTNSYVLKWSIWWAVATAGHLQVINFIQSLWEVIVTENGSGTQDYNGFVEAGHTLISSILAFGVGHVKVSWNLWGEALLAVSAVIQSGSLIWLSRAQILPS